jgi:hypothetical protein
MIVFLLASKRGSLFLTENFVKTLRSGQLFVKTI